MRPGFSSAALLYCPPLLRPPQKHGLPTTPAAPARAGPVLKARIEVVKEAIVEVKSTKVLGLLNFRWRGTCASPSALGAATNPAWPLPRLHTMLCSAHAALPLQALAVEPARPRQEFSSKIVPQKSPLAPTVWGGHQPTPPPRSEAVVVPRPTPNRQVYRQGCVLRVVRCVARYPGVACGPWPRPTRTFAPAAPPLRPICHQLHAACRQQALACRAIECVPRRARLQARQRCQKAREPRPNPRRHPRAPHPQRTCPGRGAQEAAKLPRQHPRVQPQQQQQGRQAAGRGHQQQTPGHHPPCCPGPQPSLQVCTPLPYARVHARVLAHAMGKSRHVHVGCAFPDATPSRLVQPECAARG